jgi:hypothetical protein
LHRVVPAVRADLATVRLPMMPMMPTEPLQFLLMVMAGWVNRLQLAVIDYLKEENRVLREQLGGRRLRFTLQ